MIFKELVGSWQGVSELWEDPLGDSAQTCECSVQITDDGLSYEWSRKGTVHQGVLKIDDEGAQFSDSFHQQTPVACKAVASRSVASFAYTYMEEWDWHINVCYREPTGQLLIQMTNGAPWGEQTRAVRMTCNRS